MGQEEYPVTAPFVYLDHNATTPVRASVVASMAEVLGSCGNPSSIHAAGRRARQRVEQARDRIRDGLGLSRGSALVFTGGGTEANRIALSAAGAGRLLVSAVEHDSILGAAPEATRLPVDRHGVVDLDALQSLLAESGGKVLVSIMAANNETGVLQPVAEIARLVRWAGGLFHCDAVQCIGRIPFDAREADLLTISAHKLGGPQGVGALIARSPDILRPHPGGGQEGGLRPGTENVAGIVGFGVALVEALEEGDRWASLASLRDSAAKALLEIDPDSEVYGIGAPRLPNTLAIRMPGVPAETQIIALDLAGIGVSAGAACSSGKIKPSHVLSAMGVPSDEARSTIRISLGLQNTQDEIERLIAAWRALRLRSWGRD